MDKETFVQKTNELENILRETRTKLYELEKEYVATNQPFPIGTKVKITYEGETQSTYGIVKGYQLCFEDVKPVFAKVNKDGSMHKTATHWLSWWRKPIIEVCNE